MTPELEFIPLDDTTSQNSDLEFVPVHEYDYTPVTNVYADRDELAKAWSTYSSQPLTDGQSRVGEFRQEAARLGTSLDELIAASEADKPFGDRWASKLYRNGGPLWRGVMNSTNSTKTFLVNSAYRSLSNIPGWEHLADEADKNNRAHNELEAVGRVLDEEGAVAELVTPTGAALLNNVSGGLFDIATVAAVPGGAGAVAAEGATAGKVAVAGMNMTKKLALYTGLRTAEQELTVATDHGLSPEMRMTHAGMMGGSTALFTYGFGKWAQTLGLTTSEQALTQAAKPAVTRLMGRTGLSDAIYGMALSGGENASQEASQMLWGTFAGTDTTENGMGRVGMAAATGAAMRGSAEVLPAVKNFREAYRKTQEAMPDTVKGTLDAQKANADGQTNPQPPENASPAYKDAYTSEIEALNAQKASAVKALDGIRYGESSLAAELDILSQKKAAFDAAKTRVDEFDPTELTPELLKELKKKFPSLTDEQIKELNVTVPKGVKPEPPKLSPETQAALDMLAEEQEKLVAKGKELEAKRKTAETELNTIQEKLKGLDNASKAEIKAVVTEALETERIKNELDQSSVRFSRAENDINAKFRAQEGFADLPETERLTAERALQNARNQGLVARADDIAHDILTKERAIEGNEQAGLVEAAQMRSDRISELQLIKDDPTKTDSERNDAAVELDNVKKSADRISLAVNSGRAKSAQALALGKYDADNTDPANVREYAARRKGSPLTEAESDSLTKAAVELKDVERHARQAADEVTAKIPLTKDGFVYRETLRAMRRKGSPLTAAEQANIKKRAESLYETVGDVRTLDEMEGQKVADELYKKGMRLRFRLDYAILSLEPKTFGGEVSKATSFALGLWRGYLTSFDLFPALRQGIVNPQSWPAGWKAFWKAFKSGGDTLIIDRDMKKDDYYKPSQDMPEGYHKLALLDSDTPLALHEGGMFDVTHEALPGIGAFARAFRAGLNAMRLDTFKRLINANGGLAKWDTANISALNDFINTGSGRGTLYQFEKSASVLSKFMLAPRFFSSRLQYLTGVPLMKAAYAGDNLAAKVMLKTYAKQIAGLAVMTGFAEMAGKAAFGPEAVRFYRNPFSDDPEERFNVGRLRIGDTMIDITGGLARPYRYMTALAEPLMANKEGRTALKQTDRTLLGIGRGQLAPLPSALWSLSDFYSGKNQGRVSVSDYILPWSANDMYKALQDEGLSKGAAISAFNLFGGGSYTTERK